MLIRIVLAMLATAVFAAPAHAVMGGDPPRDPQPSSADARTASNPRQEAERLYAGAYDEVAKANKDLAADKKKNADKKFRKAISRAEEAATLDTTYHEAWNLVGYCARRLGDYDKSLAAYQRCLRIRPDYAAAREYLGEAYVDLGDLPKAREQLSWLERLKDEKGSVTLRARIEAAEAKAVESAAPGDSSAAPDSAKAQDH